MTLLGQSQPVPTGTAAWTTLLRLYGADRGQKYAIRLRCPAAAASYRIRLEGVVGSETLASGSLTAGVVTRASGLPETMGGRTLIVEAQQSTGSTVDIEAETSWVPVEPGTPGPSLKEL